MLGSGPIGPCGRGRARPTVGGMRTDLVGSPSLARDFDREAVHSDVATSAGTPDTHHDLSTALEALRALRVRINELEALELDAIWRARVAGVSWRAIAEATGITSSTIRRWAARSSADGAFTRRRFA